MLTATLARRSTTDEPNGYKVRVITSPLEMEDLRPFWDAVNWHPNSQIEFFRLINDTRSSTVRPHILVLEQNGEPRCIVVGRIVTHEFRCRFGYKTINLGTVREYSVIYGGLLSCADEAAVETILSELDRMLKHRKADLIFLSHLDTASVIFRLAAKRPGIARRDHLLASQIHWRTKLPKTMAELLGRLHGKHRYWLRRLEKQIAKDFPEKIRFRDLTNDWPLAAMMSDIECVASKTYQRALGAGFINDTEHERRFAFERERGWLRVYVLYVDNQPRAFWVGTLYKNVFYSGFTGYDPGFKKYELGTLILIRVIEQLLLEGVEEIDYGLGDALYKRRFGDHSWNEASVRIFAPSFRGIAFNVIRTFIEGPPLWLQSLFRRTDLQQRLKTLWRRRLLEEGKK
jgi:GNAT acetyltransferase-like protein